MEEKGFFRMKKRHIIVVLAILLIGITAGPWAYYVFAADRINNDELYLSGYRDLEVTVEKENPITEDQLNQKVLNELATKGVVRKVTKRKIKQGDVVNVTYQGYLDGTKKKSNMSETATDIEIGSNTYIKGFETGLIGKKPGQTVTLNLKFPKNYVDSKYAGHKVKFKIKVNYIKEDYTKDTLTDQVVKKHTSYKTVKALYNGTKADVEKAQKKELKERESDGIWEAVIKKTEIKKYNKSYLKEEEANFEKSYQEHADALNLTKEAFITEVCGYTSDEYKKLKEKTCKENVKKRMIVNAIAKREKIEAKTEAEKETKVETYLRKYTKFTYIKKKKVKVTKISISNAANGMGTMRVGKTRTLSATVAPKNADDQRIKWKSSNTNIASIDEKGVITAKKYGKVTITAMAIDGSNVQATATITTIPRDGTIYKDGFYYQKITENMKKRMEGKSYHTGTSIATTELSYVGVKYYDFNGKVQKGELIVNKALAKDTVEIFAELFKNKYPIQKMKLIDNYNGDDEASMSDNNTSSFNDRNTAGGSKSKHALGRAIDINPLINPDVYKDKTLPANGTLYRERDKKKCTGEYKKYMIDKNDLAYKLFIKHGYSWGGNWKSHQDYQHFEKGN